MVRTVVLAIALCGLEFSVVRVFGADTSSDPAAASVELALRQEAQGSDPVIDRRTRLEETIQLDPESPAARWQAGYVFRGGKWQPFENVGKQPQDDSLLSAYHDLREVAAQAAEDQVWIADWCKKNGLAEQETAHLTAALAFAGDRELPNVRARLGYRLVDGRWMTLDEQREAEQYSRELMQSMQVWGHRMQNIAKRLAGSRRANAVAAAELEEIDDPCALPAAELVLTKCSEAAALCAVKFFARLDRYRSSQALARQAVYSRWPKVRAAATEALKSREHEEFVPFLLAAMHCPGETYAEVLIGPGGTLHWTHVCAREMATHWQIARYNLTTFVVRIGVPDRNSRFTRQIDGVFEEAPLIRMLNTAAQANSRLRKVAARRNDILRRVDDDLHRREALLAKRNAWTERWNARLGAVLAEATSQSFTADPRTWWARWMDEIDVEPAARKQVVVVNEDERFIPEARVRVIPNSSCLAAGTPIWTDSGIVPVEQLQIGDCVLAKEVATGELAYKPVVLTTVRDAPGTVRLTASGETIRLTEGHPVWVSGTGWTKARDLEAGMPLHTAIGTVTVDSAEPLGATTVYNLVVADFHTYFFGTSHLLSHDVTIPQLTDVLVPGLPPVGTAAE